MEENALPVYFGEWLKHRRKQLDLTQVELAGRAGCSPSGLRKIESGERRPSKQLAGLLARSLEIPPEEHTTFIRVARGELNLERLPSHGPLGSTHGRQEPPSFSSRVHLPIQPTDLIGREAELGSLERLLVDPHCRLVTITGMGGIGKTRLAIEAAYAGKDKFPDGVAFVPLAGVRSPAFVVSEIIDTLRLQLEGRRDPRTQLIKALGNKHLLLVLDNFEHLLDGVGLLTEMLESSPSLKLLVTSRECLNVQVEWVFEIEGLPVPPSFEDDHAEQYSSVALFLQRAQQVKADFDPGPDELAWIVRICQLVEGMPLAIEMAAAWVPMLACKEICQEIEADLDFLAANMHDVPHRQRSVRATFNHSWKLLSMEDRQVLSRLTIFHRGFLRDAAQQVAKANLHNLLSLVEKSLLKRSASGRYFLHELLRQYAKDKLEETPEELVAVRDRHCTYYINFVGDLEEDIKSHKQIEAISKISGEIENIRVAGTYAVREREAELIRKATRAFCIFYDTRGWLQEAEAKFGWAAGELERRIAWGSTPNPEMVVTREYIQTFRGFFLLCLGRLPEAQVLLQNCFDTLQRYEAWEELKDALNYLGSAELLLGNFRRAGELFHKELKLASQSSDPWNEGIAYFNLGLLSRAIGKYQEGCIWFTNAIEIYRARGDQRRIAMNLLFLSDIKRKLGDYQEVRAHLQESLDLGKALGDRWLTGMSLSVFGIAARDEGEYIEAVQLISEGLHLLRDVNDCWGILQALNGLGSTLAELREYTKAHSTFVEAINMGSTNQFIPETLDALVGLAGLLSIMEFHEQARRILINVSDHTAIYKETKERADLLQTEVDDRLGLRRKDDPQEWCERVTLDELIVEVLQDHSDVSKQMK